MSVYLDASVLLALFTNDLFTDRAEAFLRSVRRVVIVSDFAAAEFASAIARRVRMQALTDVEAGRAFSAFDAWTLRASRRAETTASDVAAAASFLRRLDPPLRTPDALNIAIAQRCAEALMTFDEKMATGARALGVPVSAA